MIAHQQNGYVARFCDVDDLAAGIRYVLDEADYAELGKSAVQKVAQSYSQQSVAKHYIEIYESAMLPKEMKR